MTAKARVTVEIEVRYAETDRMGVVHHSVYLVWFEQARTRLCSLSGYHYSEIEDAGFHLVVTGAELRFAQPATFGESVEVTCQLDRVSSRGLRFVYGVARNRVRLASGTTNHIWVAQRTRKPCRLPDDLSARFDALG